VKRPPSWRLPARRSRGSRRHAGFPGYTSNASDASAPGTRPLARTVDRSQRTCGRLEELEKRLEGVSAGVKQLLVEARATSTGPLAEIRGLVADLLRVSVDDAPLVEIALGETAQCLVVASSTPWLDYLADAPTLAGRVGFVRLDPAQLRSRWNPSISMTSWEC